MARPCCRAGLAGPSCGADVVGPRSNADVAGPNNGGRAGATPQGRPWQGHAAVQTWRGQAAVLTRQGHAAGHNDCFSLGASRVHWPVRQTGAEAFGCSVRRCGQLVVVSLEPTVRKLLSTSFLKTALDRPGAAESEGSVLATLMGGSTATCTEHETHCWAANEQGTTSKPNQGETAMEGVPLSRPRAGTFVMKPTS